MEVRGKEGEERRKGLERGGMVVILSVGVYQLSGKSVILE
jgi:hypothetical protein